MKGSRESFNHDVPDHDIIQDHDRNDQDLIEKYSPIDNEGSSISAKDLDSVKGTVTDSISARGSIPLKKMATSKSLTSEHSELISITNVMSELESSRSKSQTVSASISSKQNTKTVSNTLSSKTSRLETDITHDEMKDTSSKNVSWEKSISRHSLNSTLNEVSKKSIETNKDLTLKSTHSTVQESHIFQCEKTQSASSKSTLSQLPSNLDEIGVELKQRCIPPWAKTMRKIYGMSCSDSRENVSQTALQEKIKGLMDKHSRLMLVKRGESRKQLILKANECGTMGTVKLTSKNTKYYMTPLPKEDAEDAFPVDTRTSVNSKNIASAHREEEYDEISVTKKTSRGQAKTEVSHVLKTLYNSKRPQREMERDSRTLKQQRTICPKITPSNIRDYVNAQTLDPDAKQLHEIIKIKKVPSLGTQDGRKPSSKYIINVPKCTKGDGGTVNKITVKEKRKLRFNSVEDINENITEIIYKNSDLGTTGKDESNYIAEEHFTHDVVPYSKRGKSPTKSRALEVIAETTPAISNLVKKEERDRDKILLIQYEKKSKTCEGKSEADKPTTISTKLLGVKQSPKQDLKEMYLYGTETDGKKTKECITKVDDVSPTLREKVNMIFQELREMTFKPCTESEAPEYGELQSSGSSKTSQYQPKFVETDAVSVQALPEVRSAEVQVRESLLLSQSQLELKASHPSSTSLTVSEEHKQGSTYNMEDQITDIGESTENESKTRSRLEHEKTAKTTEEEGSGEVLRTDDTLLSEYGEEKGTQEEGEHSKEGSVTEEQLLEATEKGDERSETDQSQFEQHEGENQEEKILEDELTEEEQKLLEEKQNNLEEEQEALTYEDALKTKEASLKDMEDDQLKKDKDLEDQIKDKYEESAVPKDEKGEGDETSETKRQTKLHYQVPDRFSEDIRSYDFDPSQINQLRIVSSSKFFHQRESIKKMNWTDDVLYIERSTCPQLIKALAEIAVRQPADPISFLAHWIYKDYHNRECQEQKEIHKENLEVARDMISTKKDEKPVCRRLSVRRYPIKRFSSIVSAKSVPSYAETEEAEAEELQNED